MKAQNLETKAAKTPWDVERPFRDVSRSGEHDTQDCDYLFIDLGEGNEWQGGDFVEIHGPNQEKNADFLLRAVNCHDELVKMVEDYAALLSQLMDERSSHSWGKREIELDSLLKRAKGVI